MRSGKRFQRSTGTSTVAKDQNARLPPGREASRTRISKTQVRRVRKEQPSAGSRTRDRRRNSGRTWYTNQDGKFEPSAPRILDVGWRGERREARAATDSAAACNWSPFQASAEKDCCNRDQRPGAITVHPRYSVRSTPSQSAFRKQLELHGAPRRGCPQTGSGTSAGARRSKPGRRGEGRKGFLRAGSPDKPGSGLGSRSSTTERHRPRVPPRALRRLGPKGRRRESPWRVSAAYVTPPTTK